MGLVNYSVRIESELRDKIKTLSKERNMKVGALLDIALNYLENDNKLNDLNNKVEALESNLNKLPNIKLIKNDTNKLVNTLTARISNNHLNMLNAIKKRAGHRSKSETVQVIIETIYETVILGQ